MNYAGFWRRFAALLIDAIIIWLISMVTIIAFYIPPIGIIIAGFYHVIFETSPLRATPGKALMKIAVVKSNGSLLTIKDSIIRFAVSFISSFILLIGYLMAVFTQRKQTLHDIIADTIVINEVFAEQNFWEIFVNQCKVIFSTGHTHSPVSSDGRMVSSQSLEDLYNLHQKGILSDEEYRVKKEEYLKRL
jgi:uncharacterized RDD family membrane protein YckC